MTPHDRTPPLLRRSQQRRSSVPLAGASLSTHRRQATSTARRWLADADSVLLDTETTDLDGQIVEIAVTDLAGAALFTSLVRPSVPVHPQARAAHGISDEELRAAPALEDLASHLRDVLAGRRVIAYNAAFDRGVLYREQVRIGCDLVSQARWGCAMRCYTRFQGRLDVQHRWLRASRLPGAEHRAVGDCASLAKVLQEMARG